MTQDFRVLRCCECKIFQVHQVKKSNKWNCKVCGTKQSVRQVYGKGSGADCRRHVQKLNTLRGVKALEQDAVFNQQVSQNSRDVQQNPLSEPLSSSSESNTDSKESKWSKFLQGESEHSETPGGDLKEDWETFSNVGPCEVRKPHPVFRCAMDVESGGSITCPDTSKDLKKQRYINSEKHLKEKALKQTQNSMMSGDQVNQVNLGAKPSDFTSVSEKSKWSPFVKTSDSNKYVNRGNTAEKHLKPCISKQSKWSDFIKPSKLSESGEEDNCVKLNDISHIQNVKNTEGKHKGFQFILKAGLQSQSTDFCTDF